MKEAAGGCQTPRRPCEIFENRWPKRPPNPRLGTDPLESGIDPVKRPTGRVRRTESAIVAGRSRGAGHPRRAGTFWQQRFQLPSFRAQPPRRSPRGRLGSIPSSLPAPRPVSSLPPRRQKLRRHGRACSIGIPQQQQLPGDAPPKLQYSRTAEGSQNPTPLATSRYFCRTQYDPTREPASDRAAGRKKRGISPTPAPPHRFLALPRCSN